MSASRSVGTAPGRDGPEPAGLNPDAVRQDFPILQRRLAGGHRLVYLDSANTSQKPRAVIDALSGHYAEHNANTARAMHQLGAEANTAYENARSTVAAFIGAVHDEEVVFTKNATESLNLLARSLGDSGRIGAGDEVVISRMEHHSNIVPWQQLCERTGAALRWFELTADGRLDLDDLGSVVNERTKIVALTWVSNMLGTVNPLEDVIARAHDVGALVAVDGSQAVPQLPVDVTALGADFLAFTGHKMLGPTGIGVLWGRYDLLAELPPFLGGGEMIRAVAMESSTYAPPPSRFEAGTPPIAEAVGLAAAIDYLSALGMSAVAEHEHHIVSYALDRLREVDGLTVIGPSVPVNRGGAVSFTLEGVHPHDVAQLLDSRGVAVRAGHHCAKPAHSFFGVQSTTRASFYVYTTREEIDQLIEALHYTRNFFGV